MYPEQIDIDNMLRTTTTTTANITIPVSPEITFKEHSVKIKVGGQEIDMSTEEFEALRRVLRITSIPVSVPDYGPWQPLKIGDPPYYPNEIWC